MRNIEQYMIQPSVYEEIREEENRDMIQMVNALSTDIRYLICVDKKTKKLKLNRNADDSKVIKNLLGKKRTYDSVLKDYIDELVYEEDREELRETFLFENVCKRLKEVPSFVYHYRVLYNGEILYFAMKCSRNCVEGEYDSFLLAVIDESYHINDRKVRHMLEIDGLTSVYTRAAFMKHCREFLNHHPTQATDIVIADIENFRLINNIYGIATANSLLKLIGEYFRNNGTEEIWGRYSGDQFICVRAARDDFIECSDKLAAYLEENSPVPDVVIKWGIYHDVDREVTISHMCDRALMALKSIKHDYTRIVAEYDGEVSLKRYKAQLFETRFPEAIKNREFVPWYQPKYDPYQRMIVGAEALVRWENNGNYISPGEFLPVFEDDGLIIELDEYIFDAVCRFQKKGLDGGKEIIPISINLSRVSMRRQGLVERYSEIAKEYGIDSRYLPIEITESTTIGNDEISELVNEFRKRGFPIHIDDFGSGHSSLHSLNSLPIDVLKLDKGLIDFIGEETGNAILEHAIIMANELNLRTVAEGVEDEKQLRFLMEKGCDLIQGFYFSRPLPEAEFERLLWESRDHVHVLGERIKRENLSEQLKRQSLIVEGLNSLYFGIYLVDLKRDVYWTIATRNKDELVFGEVEHAKATMSKFTEIHVDEQTRRLMLLFNDLSTLQERIGDKKVITQDYIGVETGWSRAFIIPVERDDEGKVVKIIYAVRQIIQERELTEQLQERMTIIESMAKIYFVSYYIDVKNDQFVELVGSKQTLHDIIGLSGNAREKIEPAIQKLVSKGFIDGFRKFVNLDDLDLRFADKDVITYDYLGATTGWSQGVLIVGDRENDGSISHVFLAFRQINEEKAREFRDKEEAKKDAVLSIAQRERLGAINLAPDLLSSSEIGLWAFEIDDNVPPRMYVDETMRQLMGMTDPLPPEETYNEWFARVDQGNVREVEEAVKQMSCGIHAEVQYPWYHPDGSTRIVRCGGVRNAEYTRGIRLEGCHQDVTDLSHFQKQGVTELFASLSDDFASLYFVDPDSGRYEYWSHKDESTIGSTLSALEVGRDFYAALENDMKVVVEKSYHDLLREKFSRKNMKKIQVTGIPQEFEVCWKNPKNPDKPSWIQEKIVRFRDHDGCYRLLVGFRDVTKQKEHEQVMLRNNAMAARFLETFQMVYYVDLEKDEALILRYDMDKTIDHVDHSHYSAACAEYINTFVFPEDREKIAFTADIQALREYAKQGTPENSIIYRAMAEQEIRYVRITLVPGEDENHIQIGYKDVDEMVRKQMAVEEETRLLLKRSMTDELTGVLNRRAYADAMLDNHENAIDDDLVYIALDVNGLKATNDSLGHAAGDEIIVGATDCMKSTFGRFGNIYRIGGDEFVALLVIGKEEFCELKKEFDTLIENWRGELSKSLSIAYGIVPRRENMELSIDDIAKLADRKMYIHKAQYYEKIGKKI